MAKKNVTKKTGTNLKVRHKLSQSYLCPNLYNTFAIKLSLNGNLNPYGNKQTSMIRPLIRRLSKIKGKLINELKLSDLMLPAYYCNGIYLYYDDDNVLLADANVKVYMQKKGLPPFEHNIVYIGKAGGRSFIERISAHFTSRDDDYMNNMLKKMAMILYNKGNTANVTDSDIDKTFPIGRHLYLKIVYFPANDPYLAHKIEVMEKALINHFMPVLNK